MNQISPLVALHYQQEHLYEKIIAVLEEQGIDITHLTWQQLAAADEFHVRGLEATLEMAKEACLQAALLYWM